MLSRNLILQKCEKIFGANWLSSGMEKILQADIWEIVECGSTKTFIRQKNFDVDGETSIVSMHIDIYRCKWNVSNSKLCESLTNCAVV